MPHLEWFFYHLDVQGKNATNAFIVAEGHNSPMTQKAVINTNVLSRIASEPNGMREIHMDYRYSTPTLFVFMQEKYNIFACGTVRNNHTGWNPQILNLPMLLQRGMSIVEFDPVNRVLFGQWNGNKQQGHIKHHLHPQSIWNVYHSSKSWNKQDWLSNPWGVEEVFVR